MSNCLSYRYYLTIGETTSQAYPIVPDGVKRVVKKADGEEYYRTTLEGSIDFVRADYALIAGASIEDRIGFLMQSRNADGTYSDYFSGYFTKADGQFAVDECGGGTVTVSITPNDYYEAILAGMDKEFNLIELEPPTTPVVITRQPILQIYCYGASYLNNYINGMWWEQEVTSPVTSNSELENDYFFALAGEKIFIPGNSATLSPDVSGEYIRNNPGQLVFDREDGEYRLQYKTSSPLLVEIIHIPSGAQAYVGQTGDAMFAGAPGGGFSQDAFGGGAVLTSLTDSSSQVQAVATSIFARILTNASTVGGSPTEDVPASDIVPANENYSKVIGITDGAFHVSADNNAAGSRWGKFSDSALHFSGDYFQRPAPAGATKLYPVSSSDWLNCSYWFEFDAALNALQSSAGDNITLQDAYKVSDALAAVLGELDSGVSHLEDSSHSEFLYSLAGNPIRPQRRIPMIAPKSNVILGEYDKPAQKAPIKLADVLQMLWNVFRCKWHIDGAGRFRVEHIAWYENGGTYSGTNIGADLTSLIDPQTGKPWEWGANRWEYEKESMPERLEPAWMDDSSAPFDGFPVQVRSNFVQKGNVESQAVSRFTADVDFILSQGADISKDGFVLMDAEVSIGLNFLPLVALTLPNGDEFYSQNGYLAFIYLHPNYHRYGLPASLITMNEEDTTALSVTRRKIQEVQYPAVATTDYIALVTTGLGSGKILELREDVNAGYVEAKLAHDTA